MSRGICITQSSAIERIRHILEYYIKNLLLITYYWPPLGGPGSLRPVKFAKYMPEFGVKPIILTRKDIAYHSYDDELGKDIQNVEVRRTESLDPARVLFRLGMKKYAIQKWHGPIKQTINFPDNKTPWVPFAYAAGVKTDFDSILVSAPPFSAFITGYYLARRTGKPLIVDFRDAWLEFPFTPYKGMLQKRFVRHWEQKVVQHAQVIIVVDDNIKQALTSRYPAVSHKVHVIPNGFDPDDFVPVERPRAFTIAYLGTIRDERNPQNILDAIERFKSENSIEEGDISFKFIGHVEPRYVDLINQYNFTTAAGHLPYQQAIKEFCASHLAVLITTGSEYFFPSRQNEYLASGLPVVVCGESKGLHLLERAFKQGYPGWILDYDDIDGMSKRIADVYYKYKRGKVVKGVTPYKQYTRRNLTRRLAELVHKL